MLHYHISNTNADASLILQAHAGACLNLVGGAIRIDAKIAQPYLQMLTSIAAPKWTLQFPSLQDHTVTILLNYYWEWLSFSVLISVRETANIVVAFELRF